MVELVLIRQTILQHCIAGEFCAQRGFSSNARSITLIVYRDGLLPVFLTETSH
jgi:hypothetical protein